MSTKLERAAFLLAQSIRTQFADSVKGQFASEWQKLSPHQQQVVLGLVEDAVNSGHAQAYPWLLSAYEADLAAQSSFISFPDAAVDWSAKMVSRSRQGFAAFTIVRNEPFFLNLWCSYYAAAFGEDNLFVLDNSTDDGSVEAAKRKYPSVNVVSVPNDRAADWGWCTNVVKCFQRIFLRGYKVVVFSDSDEYLVPETGNLRTYCEQFLASTRNYVRSQGWGIVHQPDAEPPLSDPRDVLKNRSHAWRAPLYDKTLISKVPLEWAKGSHTIYVGGKKVSNDLPDPELTLVHLRDVDANLILNQSLKRAQSVEPARRLASFHAAEDMEQVRTYLKTRCPPWSGGQPEYTDEHRDVPEVWKRLLRQVR